MISEVIEKHFSKFLLSKITFEINGKVIKKGKLTLIAVKDFHIFFVIQSENSDSKQFIVPLPYDLTSIDQNCLCLDYTIDTLCMGNKNLFFKFKTTSRKKTSRFFDTKMYCKK